MSKGEKRKTKLKVAQSRQRTPQLISLAALFLLILLASSCVSNRKITYLQYEDELTTLSTTVTDSILRVYETGELHYTLQPNDILSIRIASMTPEEYNPFAIADPMMSSGGSRNIGQQGTSGLMGYRIDPWGYLNLPVIGQLKAQGLTIDELEDTIDSLAAQELKDPVTKINLLNFKFLVLGEVGSDGEYNSSERNLTMMQAVASAGGPEEFGNISKVKVIRRIGNESFVFYVNLLDESFLTSEFYYVYPNDMIIVPPLRSRIYFKYITPNISIITSVISFTTSLLAIFAIRGATGG
jgi:polysaccharide export outer membrane protein